MSNMSGVDSFKRGALVTNELEACRMLNLDLDDLHEGFYSVQVPVMISGEEVLLEARFQRVVSGADRASVERRGASVSEAAHACAALGGMVRIPVNSEDVLRLRKEVSHV